jgi:hypothetical protein
LNKQIQNIGYEQDFLLRKPKTPKTSFVAQNWLFAEDSPKKKRKMPI